LPQRASSKDEGTDALQCVHILKGKGPKPPTKRKAMTHHHTTINEEPVTVPNHFNELSEVKLKYHLLEEELIEA